MTTPNRLGPIAGTRLAWFAMADVFGLRPSGSSIRRVWHLHVL